MTQGSMIAPTCSAILGPLSFRVETRLESREVKV